MAMTGQPAEPNMRLNDITVIMPVGGLGTRAREVTHDAIPKHLIMLGNGQTILATICHQLQRVGFRRFVFCVGFLKEQIIEHVATEDWITSSGVTYSFVEIKASDGVDGGVLRAIQVLRLHGRALIIPGDLFLPWDRLADLCRQHVRLDADITLGLTSYITERTTDVGKIVVSTKTSRLLACYSRADKLTTTGPNRRNLTSAAATAVTIDGYVQICNTYRSQSNRPPTSPLSLRDDVLPWAAGHAASFKIYGYDLQGEILDLGSPLNIRYGQSHWRDYV